MGIFGSLFSKKPEHLLAKGEKLLSAGSFYEARCTFEKGVELCAAKNGSVELLNCLQEQIKGANTGLAKLNIEEADHAISQGNEEKGREHLHLAKSLTNDPSVREKADILLASLGQKINNTDKLEKNSGCSSCSSCSTDTESVSTYSNSEEEDMDFRIHYDLLINQFPEEMYRRYSLLGEHFAYMFIAASRDQHSDALRLLENWDRESDSDDIYWYEKGKILHRLGSVKESESSFRSSIETNQLNPMPYLGLALLLIEETRFDEALILLEQMIKAEIFTGQSIMLRAEVFQITGNLDQALDLYATLLKTPLSKAAAEKIYEILVYQDRHAEAAAVHKQYLKSCCH